MHYWPTEPESVVVRVVLVMALVCVRHRSSSSSSKSGTGISNCGSSSRCSSDCGPP